MKLTMRKSVTVLLVTVAAVILVRNASYFRSTWQLKLDNDTSHWRGEAAVSEQKKIPLTVHRPLPAGACSTYGELRDINFLHKSVRSCICRNVEAYSFPDRAAFPLCELQQYLPQLLTDPVNAGSFESYIQSPATQRNVSCFVYAGDDLISNEIRQFHIFEKENVKMMLRIIQKLNSQSLVTFVDIGANIGVFTLTALDIGVPVVALDANIRNLIRIKLSAESSNVSHKLHLLWNFISSQVSLMYLNFPQDCNVGGATKLGRAVTDTIPVMSTTADSIAGAISGAQTIVMKVDIEGGEGEFFKSAQNLFSTVTVAVVHMEWLQRHMTEDERQFMVDFFISRRYSPRSMRELNRRIKIEDPNFSDDDVVWIREDFMKDGVFKV